jgi:hypothetical protein
MLYPKKHAIGGLWSLFAALALAGLMCAGCDTSVPLDPPPVPENVIATPTFNQIVVNWTESPDADGYVVYYNTTESQDDAKLLETTIAGATITGLDDSKNYYIWVKAKNGEETSNFSAVASARTSEPLPDAFYNSIWTGGYADSYTIVDHGIDKPAIERWELEYNDGWSSSPTGGAGSYGFKGFIKYFSTQTPSSGQTDSGVIVLKYHGEDSAPLGAWDNGEPPGRGLFGAVYYHTLIAGTSATMGNANNFDEGQSNVEETTLKAAVGKFGPSKSIDTYYDTTAIPSLYAYAPLN